MAVKGAIYSGLPKEEFLQTWQPVKRLIQPQWAFKNSACIVHRASLWYCHFTSPDNSLFVRCGVGVGVYGKCYLLFFSFLSSQSHFFLSFLLSFPFLPSLTLLQLFCSPNTTICARESPTTSKSWPPELHCANLRFSSSFLHACLMHIISHNAPNRNQIWKRDQISLEGGFWLPSTPVQPTFLSHVHILAWQVPIVALPEAHAWAAVLHTAVQIVSSSAKNILCCLVKNLPLICRPGTTPTSCYTQVETFPVCADPTANMYQMSGGFFCCVNGEIAVLPLTGWGGICVTADETVPVSLMATMVCRSRPSFNLL